VKPGDAVAITLPRSARLIAGILGILKAGAAYVPLDVSYPVARLDVMLRESGAKILLGEGASPGFTTPVTWLPIENASADFQPLAFSLQHSPSPAYIMFTSGSTGVPKGVRVRHRGISRLVINTNYVEFTPADVVAHASNISFDASTFEIWGALLHGARLVIVPKETLLSPQELAGFIRERKISVLFLTTPLFHHLAREIPGAFGTLRYLVAGGDALQPEAARAVLQRSAFPSGGPFPIPAPIFSIRRSSRCRRESRESFISAGRASRTGISMIRRIPPRRSSPIRSRAIPPTGSTRPAISPGGATTG
jgi:non-ribosomal peptide synthetase component F